jgi:hypothetical protein
MDDLLEILELPVDVYAEYWGAMWSLARESPLYAAAYVVIAVILALLLIRWLRSRPMTFKRTYSGCFALALLVLPGAVGQGGLAILPLVVIIAFSVIQPLFLIYNAALLAIAALVAWIAAWTVCRAAAGRTPTADRSVDLTRP